VVWRAINVIGNTIVLVRTHSLNTDEVLTQLPQRQKMDVLQQIGDNGRIL